MSSRITFIKNLEQQTNIPRSRGRPKKARYPDYVETLESDVQVDENDERLCGFSQNDIEQAQMKKQRLRSIIEEMEQEESPFYGFSEQDMEKSTLKAQKLQDFMSNDSSISIRQVCSRDLNTRYPWNYDEWLKILENDF